LARSNQNLLELVNNLLQVYRFEAGKQRLNFSSVGLGSIVKNVARDLLPLAQEKGLHLNLEIGPILPIVMGDRLELQRVVTNLVSNAIKFTDAGSITLRLDHQPAPTSGPAAPPYVILQVKDTGIGISVADQPFLFERFRPGQHQRAGSGLGLHLSQYIVQAHGGDIKVESEQNKGSCFTVRFPVKPQVPF
jgi:signal transduction histidine kinase